MNPDNHFYVNAVTVLLKSRWFNTEVLSEMSESKTMGSMEIWCDKIAVIGLFLFQRQLFSISNFTTALSWDRYFVARFLHMLKAPKLSNWEVIRHFNEFKAQVIFSQSCNSW
jgi:hypothetical protein